MKDKTYNLIMTGLKHFGAIVVISLFMSIDLEYNNLFTKLLKWGSILSFMDWKPWLTHKKGSFKEDKI